MQLFFDKAEEAGLEPHFDIYHVMTGEEKPTPEEIAIMKQIFDFNIAGTELEVIYLTADIDFHKNISKKNQERLRPKGDNTHLNN